MRLAELQKTWCLTLMKGKTMSNEVEECATDGTGELLRVKQQWAAVVELNMEVEQASREWADAKEVAKDAKEAYDASVMRLRAAIKRVNDPQQELPFPPEDGGLHGDDGEWRSVELEELGIVGTLAERLIDAGLTTLGAISDYTAADKRLTDIKGIGDGKAEKIQAACADWWSRHPRTDSASEGDGHEAGETAKGEASDAE